MIFILNRLGLNMMSLADAACVAISTDDHRLKFGYRFD